MAVIISLFRQIGGNGAMLDCKSGILFADDLKKNNNRCLKSEDAFFFFF